MSPELVRSTIGEAIRHHQAGRLAEARTLYERALSAQPDQADALNLLGMIEHATGNSVRGANLIQRAIAINPRMPGFHTNLGSVLQASGDSHAAARAFRQALALKPDHLPALHNLGLALESVGDYGQATQTYLIALRINPRLRDVWNNFGTCQVKMGDAEAALQSFLRAVQIDPGFVDARINAANLLYLTGRLDEAEQAFRELIKQNPGRAEAHNNLGLLLMQRSRMSDAASAFRAVLAIQPDHAEAALNLGHALLELGDRDRAAAQYRALIEHSPDYAAPRLALAVAAIPMMAASPDESQRIPHDFELALDELEQWCSSRPGELTKAIGSVQPFLLAYRPCTVTGPLARYGRLICEQASSASVARDLATPFLAGRSRARLGIVSGQVRNHPVWQIILRGILASIDRERFDVRLFDTSPIHDDEARWAVRHVDHYRPQPLTVAGWAEHIERDRPDMLFYPEVGMDPVTGALAPLQLARLQIASWGHPVTTGLPTIDLFLSGEAIESADADRHYTERLIRLPGTGVLTQSSDVQSRRWSGPERKAGHVRFALCQQSMKFDPQDDALLARIAREVASSEFWIVESNKHPWATEQLVERLSATFAAEGLDPNRHIRTTPWMNPDEFLGFLDAMDVMLDCPGFSGYTTAWQALHRGIPIVTLEGRFMRQRLAAGLLRQIGHEGSIASDRESYVARAIEFAERTRNQQAQQSFRHNLMHAAAHADGNIAAIRAMEETLLAA